MLASLPILRKYADSIIDAYDDKFNYTYRSLKFSFYTCSAKEKEVLKQIANVLFHVINDKTKFFSPNHYDRFGLLISHIDFYADEIDINDNFNKILYELCYEYSVNSGLINKVDKFIYDLVHDEVSVNKFMEIYNEIYDAAEKICDEINFFLFYKREFFMHDNDVDTFSEILKSLELNIKYADNISIYRFLFKNAPVETRVKEFAKLLMGNTFLTDNKIANAIEVYYDSKTEEVAGINIRFLNTYHPMYFLEPKLSIFNNSKIIQIEMHDSNATAFPSKMPSVLFTRPDGKSIFNLIEELSKSEMTDIVETRVFVKFFKHMLSLVDGGIKHDS
jgi:hypothetical protein